jgi:hypothetical protein
MPRVAKPSGSRLGHSPVPIDTVRVTGDTVWPNPDPGWSDIACQWYVAHMGEDAPFRGSTDAASLFMWATVIDRCFRSPRLSGQLLATIRQAEAAHGTAEIDRRRVRLELERKPHEVAGIDATLRRWGVIKGGAGGA